MVLARLSAVELTPATVFPAGTQVRAVLDSLTQTWKVLPLLPADYFDAMSRCRDLGLQGGAIYDTLIAQAALRAGAVGLVTLNAKHFVRLGDDVQRLVVAPQAL
ncbi:type II toxin-antitoxin system VapC family toxin [Deinococcus sp. QL22]|uniref:type II toxin-antitoxin system VapC family toxin n=1 Tax=Deinococcus sp. QL22 TaxID=2939437 RepID=UPI002016C186|nr:hypothetical protein [Deinococcus sp. QL22]UQN10588.1 hypothetical protein M1R55_30790 [Deinococcus sp. QL22]